MKLRRVKQKPAGQIALETDNGNGKVDESKVIQALKELRDSGSLNTLEDEALRQEEEKTKFTILHDLSSTDPDKLKMHSELTTDEILIINRLYMVGQLIPKVFGDSDRNRASIQVLANHVREHRLNKMSFMRKRELDLVYAVHGADNSVPVTQSAVAKVLGLKK